MHPVHTAGSGQDAPSPFTIPADARGALAAGLRLILPRSCGADRAGTGSQVCGEVGPDGASDRATLYDPSGSRPKNTSMTTLRKTVSRFAFAAAMPLGLATFVPANSVLAATFANTDAATITMTGKIDRGDEQKFVAALGYAPNFRKLVVNSPGGSILPAYLIGRGLRTGSYEVQVADNGECVSACTLLLAAAAERSAYSSSRIAVHSASTFDGMDGTRKPETDDDLALTAKLARYMKDWGTPPVIIGKMIGTPGKEAATLTDSDLQAWNVRILTARYTPPTPYTPPPTPYTPPPYTPPPPADTRSKGQRIYDFVLRSEGTPMSKFSEIIEYNWTGKVEAFKSMGAQFTKNCGGGTCTYRGELWSPNQQVRYYVQSLNVVRAFCVKNYRTGRGACANQDTDEVIYLHKVGPNDRWLKA
jgi:ATP-dependent protease ClpP protease subunit